MFNFKQYNFRNLNVSLVVIVSTLCLISAYAIKLSDSNGAGLFKRQIVGLVLGLIIIAVVAMIDYHFIARFALVIYMIITVLVAMTILTPLRTDLGTSSYRWIDLKVIQLQPSELAKIGLIITLAVLFTKLEEKMNKISTLLIGGITMAIPTVFILNQSDLSSSLVMIFIFCIMIFAAGLSYKIVLSILGISVPAIVGFFWYIMQPNQTLLEPYQLQRIIGFLDPEKYGASTMYQQLNSIKAIATGQLYGKLLSEGPSNIRGYNSVGVNESDFIWSVIGEEFGFLGGCIIILLLGMVIISCLMTSRKAKDDLGKLLAIGVSAMFMFQIFANIGVATMILPNTGLPLPFLSYGLSSLISSMIAIGLILNIGLQQRNSVRG